MFKISNRSKDNMAGVHPELILVFEQAIKVSAIDFGIPSTGGVRTEEQQKNLYAGNKTKIDGKYYILSEAWPMDTGYEIMLFAADGNEEIKSFSDVWVTYEEGMDKAIAELAENGL